MKNLLERIFGENTVSFDLRKIAFHVFAGDYRDTAYFLNIREGRVCVVERSEDEFEEFADDENYEMIPREHFDFYDYFNRFAGSIDHEGFRRELDRVGHGKGAIRRIKDLLNHYPEIQQKGYEYEDEAQKEIVQEWLESLGLK